MTYYRARYVDPVLGRFQSEDPYGRLPENPAVTRNQEKQHERSVFGEDVSLTLSGFASGDGNNYRYVFNDPPAYWDPYGTEGATSYLQRVSAAYQTACKYVASTVKTAGLIIGLAAAASGDKAGMDVANSIANAEEIRRETDRKSKIVCVVSKSVGK